MGPNGNGARVAPGPVKEIGWAPLELSGAGLDSPLRYLSGELADVLHWHGDTFDLPPGAAHLAQSALYPHQAYAVGRHALALQFHPEVLGRNVERWLIGHACELGAAKIDIPALRAATTRHAAKLEQAAGKVWQDWLEQLGG